MTRRSSDPSLKFRYERFDVHQVNMHSVNLVESHFKPVTVQCGIRDSTTRSNLEISFNRRTNQEKKDILLSDYLIRCSYPYMVKQEQENAIFRTPERC
ncbi:hypothetical protein AVEN_16837-1 [Araneus ventricosus]|uniref:Uncharacterized protein n=1 Tax=Araneus ventricosus TaxID=182803 RepID=A0A4Y2BQV1_ARAVE|nr:hypothetical protein AVEN_16837-1 [Araneus ventricosus]